MRAASEISLPLASRVRTSTLVTTPSGLYVIEKNPLSSVSASPSNVSPQPRSRR
jgi:hypothetical protein